MSIFDEEHDEREDRWATLGTSDRGSILVVVHTYQEVAGEEAVTIRIISARRATRKERTQYEVSL